MKGGCPRVSYRGTERGPRAGGEAHVTASEQDCDLGSERLRPAARGLRGGSWRGAVLGATVLPQQEAWEGQFVGCFSLPES